MLVHPLNTMILKMFCLAFVSGLVFGQANLQLSYITEQIDQYCDLRRGCGSSRPDPNVAPPRIGKAGPRGPPGAPGPAAEVDYSRIESSIDGKLRVIREEMAQMKREIYERMGRVTQLQTTEKTPETVNPSLCKVAYRGKCFWAIKTAKPGTQARELCEAEGGKGANVYDTAHFEMIRKYLVALFTDNSYLYTGMDYNPQSGITTLANGTQSSVAKWRRGYPHTSSARTVIMFAVRSNPNDGFSGMWNGSPTLPWHGVLCEI